MKVTEWVELKRTQLISKYGRGLDEVIFRMPDGTEKDFVIKNERPAAGIVAITQDNQVVLAKQFRPGTKEILHEIPGGGVDEQDEDPSTAAARELLEETGYRGDVELVAVIPDDAYSTLQRYAFVARNCEKVQEAALDDDEYIELEVVSLDEFRELLRNAKMTDVEIGYLALDYAGLL